jgi:hypothetical protein
MEQATMVTGLHSARFPYMELHEKYSAFLMLQDA